MGEGGPYRRQRPSRVAPQAEGGQGRGWYGNVGPGLPLASYSRFSHLWRCPWGHSRQARKGCREALLQGPRPRRLAAPVLAHPTFLYLGLAIYTRLLTTTLWGGWCQDRAEQGQEGMGGCARPKEPRPGPRSQGQPSTSAGVTLLIWALSSGPWPRAGLSARGCDKQELLGERLGREELGPELQGQRVLPPSKVRQSDPFGPGRRRAAEAQECPRRAQRASSSIQGLWPGGGMGAGGVGKGLLFPLWPRGPLPLRCFGTQTGTQDSRVLGKVPCRFLLSEGRRERGAEGDLPHW